MQTIQERFTETSLQKDSDSVGQLNLGLELSQLRTELETDNIHATELWRELLPALAKHCDPALLTSITQNLDHYDFPTALTHLDRLVARYPNLSARPE